MIAITEHAGIAELSDRAFLRITGSDAIRWLNGMVTNSIAPLQPGEGNYNFLLSAQGRIQGDCTIYREPADELAFLLETSADQIKTIQQLLDKFIIMDDVDLAHAHQEWQGFLLVGPQASWPLESMADRALPKTGSLGPMNLNGHEATVIAGAIGLLPTFEVWFDSKNSAEHTFRTVLSTVHTNVTPGVLEALRVLEAQPKFGIDITARDLPQETNQPHALHFAKGCYLGQEIVERIRSRGQVHRLLTPFRLEGDLPHLPAPLEANGKPAGDLTSAVRVGDDVYALGYARREALEAKHSFTYSGGTALPRTAGATHGIQQHENTHG